MKDKIRICGITTLQGTIKSFMLKNLQYANQNGFEAFCISMPGDCLNESILDGVKFIPIMEMKWGLMSPVSFAKCVYRLYKIFKKEKFDIIQYATSNAAFCASIAGWLAKVPVRINLQWGISYPVYSGLKRILFYYSTLITCRLSTSVQPDSRANLKFAINEKLYPASKGCVLYNGSACGVDLQRYDINQRRKWREDVRRELSIENFKYVFGFVGRVVVEKGVNELLEAFMSLEMEDSCLVIVGGMNNVESLNQEIYQKARVHSRISFVGPVPNTARYYAAFDYLVLPSYQEGFGMCVLEAAGVGTPSIVTNIKGPTDLIDDGYNGFVCDVKSTRSLRDTMKKAVFLSELEYEQMSLYSYEKAKSKFDSGVFKQKFLENRVELLRSAKKEWDRE